eukprot:c28322_g2_i1 orf=512-1555(+)
MAVLIEGLPNAVALQCLARVPLYCYPNMRAVCRIWRTMLQSPELYELREKVGSAEEWLYVSAYEPDRVWQAYDPLSNRWTTLPPLPTDIKHLSNFGTAAVSSNLYVIGGGSDDVDPITADRDNIVATSEVWVYNAVHRTWNQKAPMLMARTRFACCVLGMHIIVAGGFTDTRDFAATAEMYDPAEDKWEPIAPLSRAISSPCSGVVLEGKVYVVHRELPMAQVYEASENRWDVVDCFWSQGPMGVVNGELYVLFDGIVMREHKEPALKVTICSSPFIFRRVGFGVAGLCGELYVVGGVTWPKSGDTNLEPLSEVWICRVDGERPFWHQGPSMTVSKGTILGCVVLKL